MSTITIENRCSKKWKKKRKKRRGMMLKTLPNSFSPLGTSHFYYDSDSKLINNEVFELDLIDDTQYVSGNKSVMIKPTKVKIKVGKSFTFEEEETRVFYTRMIKKIVHKEGFFRRSIEYQCTFKKEQFGTINWKNGDVFIIRESYVYMMLCQFMKWYLIGVKILVILFFFFLCCLLIIERGLTPRIEAYGGMSTVIGLVLVMLYFTLYLPCNFFQNHISELKLVKKNN